MEIDKLNILDIIQLNSNETLTKIHLSHDDVVGDSTAILKFDFEDNNSIKCKYIQIASTIGFVLVSIDKYPEFNISNIELMMYSKKELLEKILLDNDSIVIEAINKATIKLNNLKKFKASNTEFDVTSIMPAKGALYNFAKDKTYRLYAEGDYKGNILTAVLTFYMPFCNSNGYAIIYNGYVKTKYMYINLKRTIKERDIKGHEEFVDYAELILDYLSKNNIFEDATQQIENDIDLLSSKVEVH
jgi:hypothetical protein